MAELDIEKLKADIKAEVIKEITGKDYLSPNKENGPLATVRKRYRGQLLSKYGTYHFDQVWQHIRRLSCYVAGVKYVRDLTPSREEQAAEFAEAICEMMIGEV